MKKQRGLTFVTVLIALAGLAGIYWIITYGEAYWDNFEVQRLVKEAANLCYREPNDERVKDFVFLALHRQFDEKAEDQGRVVTQMKIIADRDDMRIERTESPRWVHVWLTYSRDVQLPIIGGSRRLTFIDHAEQDLSPVKW